MVKIKRTKYSKTVSYDHGSLDAFLEHASPVSLASELRVLRREGR